ncbi:MAG: hypothetical protein JW741_10055 [Sedimentisphaerales bacterium]|nr:hypothetical protein [Sedimentisphaerales bacterium]
MSGVFGESEDQGQSGESEAKETEGTIDEGRIACIVLSIGSPALSVTPDDAARFYQQINPTWSGRHQIHVSCTSSEIPLDGEGLSTVVWHALDLEFVSRLAQGGCTVFVQDCNLASQPDSTRVPAAFCTFVPSGEKQIIMCGSDTPIPMCSAAFEPKDPSLSSGLPFSKLKHIFLFTDRDGASVTSSQAVTSVIESVTGQPMEAINIRIPISLVRHSAVGVLLAQEGRFPDIGLVEIEKGQPQLAREIRQGTLTLCCRPVKTSDSGEQVGVVAIYSR